MPYLGNSPQNNIRQRFYYTATAGQTVFSGADDNGTFLKYQDGKYLDVYLNGVLLQDTIDYTALTKSSVTLLSGASVGDLVEIVAYGVFSVSDTVSASLGGTFSGNVGIGMNTTAGARLSIDGATYSNGSIGIGVAPSAYKLKTYQIGGSTVSATFGTNQVASYIGFRDTVNNSDIYVRVGSSGNNLAFITNSTERMRVTSSGDVGIGTASPAVPLHIKTSTGIIYSETTAARNSNNNYLSFRDPSGEAGFIGYGAGTANSYFWNALSGDLRFGTNDTERMRIDASGNVGIGTSVTTGAKLLIDDNSSATAFRMLNSGTLYTNFYTTATGTTLNHVQSGILTFGTNNTERMRIDAGGNVLMGYTTTQGAYKLQVTGGAGLAGATAWTNLSDGRIKKDVITISDGLEKITQLNPVTFGFHNEDEHPDPRERGGFVAQEVMEVFPEMVTKNAAPSGKDKELVDTDGSAYDLTLTNKFHAYVVAAIKDLKAENDALRSEFDAYKAAHP